MSLEARLRDGCAEGGLRGLPPAAALLGALVLCAGRTRQRLVGGCLKHARVRVMHRGRAAPWRRAASTGRAGATKDSAMLAQGLAQCLASALLRCHHQPMSRFSSGPRKPACLHELPARCFSCSVNGRCFVALQPSAFALVHYRNKDQHCADQAQRYLLHKLAYRRSATEHDALKVTADGMHLQSQTSPMMSQVSRYTSYLHPSYIPAPCQPHVGGAKASVAFTPGPPTAGGSLAHPHNAVTISTS